VATWAIVHCGIHRFDPTSSRGFRHDGQAFEEGSIEQEQPLLITVHFLDLDPIVHVLQGRRIATALPNQFGEIPLPRLRGSIDNRGGPN